MIKIFSFDFSVSDICLCVLFATTLSYSISLISALSEKHAWYAHLKKCVKRRVSEKLCKNMCNIG